MFQEQLLKGCVYYLRVVVIVDVDGVVDVEVDLSVVVGCCAKLKDKIKTFKDIYSSHKKFANSVC